MTLMEYDAVPDAKEVGHVQAPFLVMSTPIQCKFAKNKKDESTNKLTTSLLITYNDKVQKPTRLTIFKSAEYLCLWIYNVENAKVIDWICTGLNLI
ncbi:hypothetical protein MTR_2g026705 [Medicago truncatula]|uniref:Uncharacterized protein n=1 Tax=Medicago truncatula TaxID=3880 RepID=A0A072V4R4_MEDTR|nr:hypothetical protein MTR_2g026705 [Medicago truncatula]